MQGTNFATPLVVQHSGGPTDQQTKSADKTRFNTYLDMIRHVLEQAITHAGSKHSSDWWMKLPAIRLDAVAAQKGAIEKSYSTLDGRTVAYVGTPNQCIEDLANLLAIIPQKLDVSDQDRVDVIVAPHTLYSEMESIFKATEELIHTPTEENLVRHPLTQLCNKLTPDGCIVITMKSGPNVQDFTNIMLQKAQIETPAGILRLFDNVETFLRCLDIYARHLELLSDKVIRSELSFSLPHIPLASYADGYVRQYPELQTITQAHREQFVRLLAAFTVDQAVVECHLTVKIHMHQKKLQETTKRSFKPVGDFISYRLAHKQTGTNELSFGQLDTTRQLQNLNGSELAIPYMKEADGVAQGKAIASLMNRQRVNMLDIGGSYGETNAVPQLLSERGIEVRLLNIDPDKRTFESYAAAHHRVGIHQVHSLQMGSQDLVAKKVVAHFGGEKVDLIFSSHALYFEIADMLKASLDDHAPLSEHPFYKYFEMLASDGVFVITMQSGAGSRIFRNALLGNHGLDRIATDDVAQVVENFKNIGSALRYLEQFKNRYKQETGKTIRVNMHYAVANVPLGDVENDLDNPQSLTSQMLEFYSNWTTLQKTAMQSPDALQREAAIKTQNTFMKILPAFAVGRVNMQHPNITLEITVEK